MPAGQSLSAARVRTLLPWRRVTLSGNEPIHSDVVRFRKGLGEAASLLAILAILAPQSSCGRRLAVILDSGLCRLGLAPTVFSPLERGHQSLNPLTALLHSARKKRGAGEGEILMLGTGEPRLQPLDPELGRWADATMRRVSPSRLRADVEGLPAPRNRLHAPEAMARADEMIMQNFRDPGWAAERRPYEWKNVVGYLDYVDGTFPAGARPTIYRHLAGANVLGVKEGLSSRDAVIVGAHHDTIRDSPGADDNTASVAALFELARVLAPYCFRDTVVLAATDMEEINFFGSKALVTELSRERRIKGAIIYETMAYTATAPGSQSVPLGTGALYPSQISKIRRRRFVGDWTIVVYRVFAASMAQSFGEGLAHIAGPDAPILMRDPVDLPILGSILKYLMPGASDFARGDHISFWEAGIPAILISDTANFRNPHYHQPTDTPDKLDYHRLAAIVGATAVVIARMAGLVHPAAGPP